jgi:hypothetical protein
VGHAAESLAPGVGDPPVLHAAAMSPTHTAATRSRLTWRSVGEAMSKA